MPQEASFCWLFLCLQFTKQDLLNKCNRKPVIDAYQYSLTFSKNRVASVSNNLGECFKVKIT